MSLNPNRCPRCGGMIVYRGSYYDRDKGECSVYECMDCGYTEIVCHKITYTFNG